MTDKTFKPVVLLQHKSTGLANMWTQRLWNFYGERVHAAFHVVGEADTPEEKAKLWKVRADINSAIKMARNA